MRSLPSNTFDERSSVADRQSNQFLHKQPYIFARHETFHPRYGWLKKGFETACVNSEIFTRDDASVTLGVGKNMVQSIRYWCHAFKILEERQIAGNRSRSYIPTHFGEALFKKGWDPFIEDPASMWLLHWYMLKPPCYATTWFYVFNFFHHNTFDQDDLLEALNAFVDKCGLPSRPNPSSLSKDINCLLRMYVSPNNIKTFKEDSIDCPFSELGLLTSTKDGKNFSFNIGAKTNLPSHIIVAACLDYVAVVGHTAKTILLSMLCFDVGSPGQAFKLSEDNVYHAIEEVAEEEKNIFLSETEGLIQFVFLKDPSVLSEKILNSYYSGIK